MSDIFKQEMGHFIDSLSSSQRTMLGRLIGEFLTPIPNDMVDDREEAMMHLQLIISASHEFRHVLDIIRQYNAYESDIRPFGITYPEAGKMMIELSPKMNHWHGLSSDNIDIQNLDFCGTVLINVHRLEFITSTLISWMIKLSKKTPNKKIHIIGANDIISKSFKSLRLDSILKIIETDDDSHQIN